MQRNKRGQHRSCDGFCRACPTWTAVEFVPKFCLCLSPANFLISLFLLISINKLSRAGYVSMCLSWNWTKICTCWLSEKLDGKCLARGHEVPASRPARSIPASTKSCYFQHLTHDFFFSIFTRTKICIVLSKVSATNFILFFTRAVRCNIGVGVTFGRTCLAGVNGALVS